MANELRRLDDGDGVPMLNLGAQIPGLNDLPKAKREEIIAKHNENMVEVVRDASSRMSKSRVAEHDLNVSINTINQLDQERKIYSVNQEFETGSGKLKLAVKGGDVRFIVPILAAIGIIIVLLIVVFLVLTRR